MPKGNCVFLILLPLLNFTPYSSAQIHHHPATTDSTALKAESAEVVFLRGKQLWEEGFLERAKDEWEKVVENDSAYASSRYYIGQYYWGTKEYGKAEEYFLTALGVHQDAETLVSLARCQIRLGELEQAEENLEKALDFNRRSFTAKLGLAEVYLQRNELDKAEGLVREVLLLKKDEPHGYYLLGRLAEAGGDYDSAVNYYRTGINFAFQNDR